MAKILHTDIKEGRVIKIQDNIIIGGDNQLEAAKNYIHPSDQLVIKLDRAMNQP